MTRRAWLAASIAASVLAVLIAVSGGVATSVGGVRMSARSWSAPALAGLLLGGIWLWSAVRARGLAHDAATMTAALEGRARCLTAALAGLVSLAGFVFATYSASGADASGYLSQADMWSRFATRVADPLVTLPGWPLAPGDTAPLGWRPSLAHGWQVPTYAPGLPWLMAVPHGLAGTAGAMGVIALAAGMAVWATGALAARLGGGIAALVASVLLATSPTFLYQAFQPMSDVPVTAAWAACWWLVAEAAPAGAGVAAGIAVLVRPNLAPLAAVPWLVMIIGSRAARRRTAVRFALPVAAAGALIALLQWHWYGSPLASGYGATGELFTLANLPHNAGLYAAWLWDAESAFVVSTVLGLACGSWASRSGGERAGNRAVVVGLLVFATGVTLAYLVYAVFEVWSYLRFLLPAIAAMCAMAGGAVAHWSRRLPAAWRGTIVLVVVVIAAASGLHRARTLGVFRVAAVTARAREVGSQLALALPPRAVLLAGEQSGSMRYATGHPIVRWETLDAATLRAALASLRAHGYEPWWVLDQFEESRVRSRFRDVPEAALDWPPELEGGPLMRTRAWRISSASGGRATP